MVDLISFAIIRFKWPSNQQFDSSSLKLHFIRPSNQQGAVSQFLYLHKTWKNVCKCTLCPYKLFNTFI